jgi:outer membrane protein
MPQVKMIVSLLVFVVSSVAYGQVTIAYANSEYVMTSHPLYADAIKAQETYQKELSAKVKNQEDFFNLRIEQYQEAIELGASEERLKKLENELYQLNEQLRISSQEADKKLAAKNEELTIPIVDDVSSAIKTVSKKLKLNALFQSTNNEGISFVIYAPEETEVTEYLLRETESGKARIFATEYKTEPSEVKIGYTNVELVLMYMPEMEQLEQTIQIHIDKLTDEYQVKSDALYEVYTQYQNEEASLTDEKRKDYETKITELSLELEEFKDESQYKIGTMRAERREEILTKLQTAIDKIAETNGFTFILNQTTSSGVSTIVYGPEDCDVTSALFNELGIEVQEIDHAKLAPKDNLKVGFVNVEMLLSELPEVKLAQERIEKFSDRVTADQKSLSDSRTQEANEKAWAEAEASVRDYQTDQLQPIMTQIQTEIDKIAKARGYDYIINQTGGNVLHIAKQSDLNPELKKALGLK